ncbi:MAG: undecaprenyl-phosphate glucose phosphotransferase [Xanthomonadales bacterium]|nr:undecaprenyl-phosphate glucose phosphotransferase [Gammaproteobacteria bacterium]NNE04457.1 undecaprenyl-phosphate glucose phosphotransferase [Xanthomonadales bacterium]NNL96349.1 undecaprenyl-phosphate glucose phosphotransferase [Xanthomonadales bacterium]
MGNLASLLVILVSCVLAYFIRFDTAVLSNAYLLALLSGLLLSSVVLPATGAYRDEFRWDPMRKLRRIVAGWALVVMMLIAAGALLKVSANYSRIWFGSWVLISLAGLITLSLLQYAWTRMSGRSDKRRMVLVGSGAAAGRVERRLANDKTRNFDVMARFGERWAEQSTLPITDLGDYLAEHQVDEVWVAVELENQPLLDSALAALRDSLVDVYVVPDLHQYRLLNQNVSEWQGLPVISLSGTPMTGSEWRLKAALDRLGAGILLAVAMPLLLGLSVLVRASSPGPVIFRQLRHGIGGEPIKIYKFRTMKVHQEPDGQFTQASPGDHRVTWIGRLLRRSSLDELPQLLNVLRGEMSLVGPRPHPVELNHYYLERIPRYMLRHKAKPGITGWAQVNGFRGMTDTDEKMILRIEHDLWYIQNWSLWLDLQILFRTPFAMFGRNAL